jgi:hypothetical protein
LDSLSGGGRLRSIAKSRSVTGTVLAATSILVVVLAVTASGVPVNHVSANDGGVWLVDDTAGTGFAEMNVPIQQLGAHFGDPGSSGANDLDLLQHGTTILAVDEEKNTVYPVDEEAGTINATDGVTFTRGTGLSSGLVGGGDVALGGPTVAILAPGTGSKPTKLLASGVGSGAEASLSGVAPSAKPLASVPATALAVDDQGDVFVASSSELNEYSWSGVTFEPPVTTAIPKGFSSIQITTVGNQAVVFDDMKGLFFFPSTGGTTQLSVRGPYALQQSGPESTAVVVESPTTLVSVPISGGAPITLAKVAGGNTRPAQPVTLDGCAYGAWGGAPGYDVRVCPGSATATPAQAIALQYEHSGEGQVLYKPVLRVNNGFVVLNDDYDGGVWLVAGNPAEVLDNDNWIQIFVGDKATNSNNSQGEAASQAQKPKLNNPPLQARPGQESVLHLLDDDTDPNGSPLSITSVSPAGGPDYTLSIAPDTQTVILSLEGAASGSITFSYSVIDGKGQTASGPVSVQAVPTSKETPPYLLRQPPLLHVVSGGTESFGVLSDWRDAESDSISLVDASASAGQVSWTSDGLVTYTAPTTTTDQAVTLTYDVTDGRSAPVVEHQSVDVVGTGDTTAWPATAEADVAKVVVGVPATVSPLTNDIFGADPSNSGAKLALAGQIASVTGLEVATNTENGQISVTATQVGTFLLSYQDAFGSAPLSPAAPILIDAVPPPPAASQPPVTAPVSALIHGTNATTVDVLNSDYDPAGGLLTVTGLLTPLPPGIEASVQQGEFIRIQATSPPNSTSSPDSQVLAYEVSDGKQSAAGQVDVTEEPALTSTPPVVPTTYVSVRAGNEIDVPVLAGASDPDGETISLVTGSSEGNVVALATSSPLSDATHEELGSGSVSGAYLRYEAPPSSAVPTSETVTASFIVEATDGTQTTGQTVITVLPETTASTQPEPGEVDARVAAGGTVTIPIPTTGVDPDGQDVTVTGITSAPQLGQILAVNADSIVYQAYPVSSTSGPFEGGTDTFSYQVTSPTGQSAQANIRVGVTPPASVQPPVAVDHFGTGAPGKEVVVDLLAGDVIAAGDPVTVEPLSQTNHQVPSGAQLLGGDSVEVQAPTGGQPVDLAYAITDDTGSPSVAHVIVRSVPGYQPQPVASDYYPTLPSSSDKTVSVDVLQRDSDPGGTTADLKVIDASVAHAVARGSTLVVPVKPEPSAVPYTIESMATGKQAVGVIHVPGSGTTMHLNSDVIRVPEGGAKSVDIGDYITDPGHTVRITTTSSVHTSPAFGLSFAVTGNSSLRLIGAPGYQGPGSVIVQVTDAASLSAAGAAEETFAIPVIIGNPTAIVRCPGTPIDLVQGGRSISADIRSLCQVWTPTGQDPSMATFTESWVHQASAVSLSSQRGGRSIDLVAASSAVVGTTGQIAVGVPGGGVEASSTLNVTVIAAPPASVTPVDIPGVETGHSVTVDMSQYVQSPLSQPKIAVLKVIGPNQGSANVTNSGSDVTISPKTGSSGTEIFTVLLTDQGQDRQVQGTITLQVLDVPSAPTNLQGTPSNDQVALSWAASQPNGAPVTKYVISTNGQTESTTGTSYTWMGLTDGQNYTFSVVAWNQVGPSTTSATGTFQPKSIPGAPGNVTASAGNQVATISWSQPNTNGQPILGYQVTISPSSGGPSSESVSAGQLSYQWQGLNNNIGPYTFTVTARNDVGNGPTSTPSRPVYAHFRPQTPAAPTAEPEVSPDGTTTTVTVKWPEITPCNDAQPCQSYIVTELKGGSALETVTTTGGCGGSTTQCSYLFESITNDGSAYAYELQAVNQEGDISSNGAASNVIHADGAPSAPENVTAMPKNSAALVSFILPPSHGASISQVDYTAEASSGTMHGSWSNPGVSGQPFSMTIPLTPNTPYSITLVAENELGEPGQASTPVDVTPYGNPQAPTPGDSTSGTYVTWSWSGGGGSLPQEQVADYYYCINGAQPGSCNNAGTASPGSAAAINYPCDSTEYMKAYVVDQAGDPSPLSSITASAYTGACPSVTISQGGQQLNGYCTVSFCDAIVVTLSNFEPNQAVTVWYSTNCATWISGGVTACGQQHNYVSETYSVGGNGDATVSDRSFGWPGASVWVNANAAYPGGVPSNTIQWTPITG